MAKLKRINPFNEIKKNEFHSVVILGYSFDFYFFEHIVLKSLKRNSISNINLIVDYKSFTKAMKNSDTGRLPCNLGYHIESYSEENTFHPKVIQFYGDKYVQTFIGSGNPTSSGYGPNLELWYGVKVDKDSIGSDEITIPTWNFINELISKQSSIIKLKFEWILKFTPLIPNADWNKSETNTKVIPIINNKKLLDQIEVKGQIQDVVVCSPFFDSKLTALKSVFIKFSGAENYYLIHDFFQNSNIRKKQDNIKILNEWNLLPVNRSIKEFGENDYLHAKFVYVKTSESSYAIIGSSNCSSSGFGIENPNVEYNVLLGENQDNFLLDLGIDCSKDKTISSDKISFDESSSDEEVETVELYRIVECSFQGFTGKIVLNKLASSGMNVVFQNSERESVYKVLFNDFSSKENVIKVDKSTLAQMYMVHLEDENGLCVSNKIHVVDKNQVYKTNPDPNNKKVFNVLSRLENGDVEFFEVYNLLSSEFLNTTEVGTGNNTSYKEAKNKEDTLNEEEFLDYKSFKRKSDQNTDFNIKLQRSLNLGDVFSVLNSIFQHKRDQELEGSADMEEEGVDVDEVEKDDSNDLYIKKSVFSKYSKSFTTFFSKFLKYLSEKDREPLGLYDLSLSLVTFQLLWATVEKTLIVKGETKTILDLCKRDDMKKDDFKWIAQRLCGLFLMKISLGIKQEDDDFYKERIEVVQKNIFHYLCLILGVLGKENMFYGADYSKKTWDRSLLISYLNLRKSYHYDVDSVVLEGIYNFSSLQNRVSFSDILSSFTSWTDKAEKLCFSDSRVDEAVAPGDLVYSNIFGFVDVFRVNYVAEKGKTKMTFLHPSGDNWNDDENCYSFKKEYGVMGKFYIVIKN
jgi:hypothetical protein